MLLLLLLVRLLINNNNIKHVHQFQTLTSVSNWTRKLSPASNKIRWTAFLVQFWNVLFKTIPFIVHSQEENQAKHIIHSGRLASGAEYHLRSCIEFRCCFVIWFLKRCEISKSNYIILQSNIQTRCRTSDGILQHLPDVLHILTLKWGRLGKKPSMSTLSSFLPWSL